MGFFHCNGLLSLLAVFISLNVYSKLVFCCGSRNSSFCSMHLTNEGSESFINSIKKKSKVILASSFEKSDLEETKCLQIWQSFEGLKDKPIKKTFLETIKEDSHLTFDLKFISLYAADAFCPIEYTGGRPRQINRKLQYATAASAFALISFGIPFFDVKNI